MHFLSYDTKDKNQCREDKAKIFNSALCLAYIVPYKLKYSRVILPQWYYGPVLCKFIFLSSQ